MGEVYVARHRHLGKDVAVKFLRRDLTTDDEAVTRFQREARAAAAVGHRGIIDVYDVGTAGDGAPYIVMELLEGESLRALLDRSRTLEVDRIVAIVAELLSALVVAHAKGIVHRDLKPDNVFLERTDGPSSVKLLDFGIAKMTEGASVHLTRTGYPIGTVPYMSPEQAQGVRDPDARVDVYAVGVILYEALAGRRPFESESYTELLVKILREQPPPLGSLRPDVPAPVEAVVMRALQKDPAHRFASAADLLAALRQLDRSSSAEPSTPAPSPSWPSTRPATGSPTPPSIPSSTGVPRRRRSPLVALAAVVVLGTVVFVAATSGRTSTPARVSHARRATAPAVQAKSPPAPEPVVTIALVGVPAGARVTFDGALVTELPIRVAPRDTMVSLRIEADGFEPHAQLVSASRNTTLRISLVSKAPPRTPAPPVVRRVTGRRDPAAPRPAGTNIQTDTSEFGE